MPEWSKDSKDEDTFTGLLRRAGFEQCRIVQREYGVDEDAATLLSAWDDNEALGNHPLTRQLKTCSAELQRAIVRDYREIMNDRINGRDSMFNKNSNFLLVGSAQKVVT
mmetsp:Transcript_30231/g.73687  ORF Transcript_30231/g.73687 Transcript_30231/m.73687 type:complete len:109 (+) Transcript_30231:2-328(+)